MFRRNLRKQAYQFVKRNLAQLPFDPPNANQTPVIPLDDLVLLKAGLIDPTPALVSSLKQLYPASSIQAEIDAYLLIPFNNPPDLHEDNCEEL
jgi:hypothetical protein